MKKNTGIFLLFFLGIVSFSQNITVQKKLLEKAQKNHELILTNSQKSFIEAQRIEKTAQKAKANEAELLAINTQCIYYKMKSDIGKGMSKAKLLSEKAALYNNYTYQIFSTVWIADNYIYNKLYDQAFEELERGRQITKNINRSDSLVIRAKSNLYLAYCNYYLIKQDSKNQLKYAKLSIDEYKKYPDKKIREKQLFLDYSNLAIVYYNINIDSAKYYAELSLSKDIYKNRSDTRFNNFLILGMTEMDKHNPEKALAYLLESEKNTNIKNDFTVPDLYENIITAYKKLGKNKAAEKYVAKRDSLKLKIAETRNNTLYKTLEEEKKKNSGTFNYLYVVLVCIIITLVLFVILRKQRRHVPRSLQDSPKGENYSELLKMLKENNPAFIPYFNKMFPQFNSKLLKINARLLPSDLEFCALMKLKIPTHNIAQYKNITIKSVQNKKYSIRKKLNIPTEADIYNYFCDL